jgi:Bifunctional DNA primase/polymerase, N-terminal
LNSEGKTEARRERSRWEIKASATALVPLLSPVKKLREQPPPPKYRTASHVTLEVVLSMSDYSNPKINTSKESTASSPQKQELRPFFPSAGEAKEAMIRASHVELQRKNVDIFYNQFGFATIPLVYGSKKNPIVKWIPYQDKYPTPEEIEQWFFSSPDTPYNVAVVLGGVSQNLIALDVDSPEGHQIFAKALAELGYCNNLRSALINTFMTRSGGGGFHFLLRIGQTLLDDERDGEFYRELLFGKAKRELWRGDGEHQEIALLSKGSMAVLSPSVHPDTGGWYVWNQRPSETLRTHKEIKELFAMFGIDLSKEKAKWRKEQGKAEKRRQQLQELTDDNAQLTRFESAIDDDLEEEEPEQAAAVVLGIKELTSEQSDAFLEWLLPIYKRGDRNRYAMGVAGILLKDGFSLDSALAFVQHLCDITQDEEVKSRLETVRHTYRKNNLDDVAGWSVFDED